MIATTPPAAVVWQRFVTTCQQDPELGPYMGTVMTLAGAVLRDPEKNLAILARIAAHLERAKEPA